MQSCKANSTYRTASVTPGKAMIILEFVPELPNFCPNLAKLGEKGKK